MNYLNASPVSKTVGFSGSIGILRICWVVKGFFREFLGILWGFSGSFEFWLGFLGILRDFRDLKGSFLVLSGILWILLVLTEIFRIFLVTFWDRLSIFLSIRYDNVWYIQNDPIYRGRIAKWIKRPPDHWVPGSDVPGSIPDFRFIESRAGNRNLHDQGL